jgi:hypothetical protein
MPRDENTRGVLGLRLSHLSEHEAVRQSILTRVRDNEEDPLAVARSITATVNNEDLYFDLLQDDKDLFVANLNKLLPEPPRGGDRYSTEVGNSDNSEARQHDWDVWDERLQNDPNLRSQLRSAVIEVLTRNQPVRVSGEGGTQAAVVARGDGEPELVFRVPPQDLA